MFVSVKDTEVTVQALLAFAVNVVEPDTAPIVTVNSTFVLVLGVGQGFTATYHCTVSH